jgi:hypothetical protein
VHSNIGGEEDRQAYTSWGDEGEDENLIISASPQNISYAF